MLNPYEDSSSFLIDYPLIVICEGINNYFFLIICMERRKFLTLAGAVGVGGLAGCTYNPSARTFELSSSPVNIPNFLIEQTFVEQYTVSRIENTDTIEYQGEEREVEFESWLTKLSPSEEEDPTEAWFYVQPNKQIGGKDLNRIDLEDPNVMKESGESKWSDFVFGEKNNEYSFEVFGSTEILKDFSGYVNTTELGTEDVDLLYLNTVNSGDEIAFLAGIPSNDEYKNDVFSIVQSSDHPSNRSEIN